MKNQEVARLAEMYLDDVYRIALVSCKSSADADDIVQNTFLKLLGRLTKFNSDEHAKRWLIRVAINEANMLWRKRKRAGEVQEEEAPAFYDELETEEGELLSAIRALPDRYRQIIHLYYFEEYNSNEIAGILKLSPDNVRQILSRARKQLREELKEEKL